MCDRHDGYTTPSGERTGDKRARGAPGKTPFVAAVETAPDGKPDRVKLRRVTNSFRQAIWMFAERSLDPDGTVVSDGPQCFGRVRDAGYSHQVIITSLSDR